MKCLAVIPARGGSKRIPRKNIREFCGKPILGYSVMTALESRLFDEIMVSTDDAEIADVAKKEGASIPFMRSPQTANDFTGLLEVLKEVHERYSGVGRRFDLICCMLATAPLVRADDLRRSLDLMLEKDFDSVFPVVRFDYPIWRGVSVEDGKTTLIWPENYDKRSQDLSPVFHDAGLFYWIRPERCFAAGRIFTANSGSIELPDSRVQDIDTEDDWTLCELKYRLQLASNGKTGV